jgi:hypothetical protein
MHFSPEFHQKARRLAWRILLVAVVLVVMHHGYTFGQWLQKQ